MTNPSFVFQLSLSQQHMDKFAVVLQGILRPSLSTTILRNASTRTFWIHSLHALTRPLLTAKAMTLEPSTEQESTSTLLNKKQQQRSALSSNKRSSIARLPQSSRQRHRSGLPKSTINNTWRRVADSEHLKMPPKVPPTQFAVTDKVIQR